MNVCIWIFIGFQQRGRQDSRNINDDTIFSLPVIGTHFIIGTEKYRDAGIFLNFYDGDYSQRYDQVKEVFRALAKDDILEPHVSDHDSRSLNVRADDVGYRLYVFKVKCQEIFTASQPFNVEIMFLGLVPNDVNGYALVLTNKSIPISGDVQRRF